MELFILMFDQRMPLLQIKINNTAHYVYIYNISLAFNYIQFNLV